jgi:hypothetical protein
VQHRARQRKENPVNLRDLQPPATPDASLVMRFQVSGSSPLVGSLSIQLVQASIVEERLGWQGGETETRTLSGRRRTNVEKLTDRLNAPVRAPQLTD